MEKREEIKEGVKERIIEFMAEQITKEESFLDLKSELIKELFAKKITKQYQTDESVQSLFDRFTTAKVDKQNKFEFKREDFIKRLNDIKTGHENVSLKDFIKDTGNYSDTHKDVLRMLEREQDFYTAESFSDAKLKYVLSDINKETFRATHLESIQNYVDNPVQNAELYKFEIKTFINGENSYKVYELMNKLEKFNFCCSFVYNKQKEERFIDKLFVDSAGLLLANDDLGIPFAVRAMEIMDKADKERQDAVYFEKENEEFQNTIKEQINTPDGPF